MQSKPTGFVTFLFTDIEGSTKLAQEFPDTLPAALEKHHSILNNAIESNNGFVFEIIGDAFCAAFTNAEDAIKAAVMAQKNLGDEKWDEAVIKIRIGIHSGKAEWNGSDYIGYLTLARTQRVMSCTYGEQMILSNDSYSLISDKTIQNISFRDLGEKRLKDLIEPLKLFQIVSPGLREDFPPLKTLDARPNNLPIQLTSFIGRQQEINHIKDLLKQTHLLTLTGAGGAGKTRLSLQVGADIIDDFQNGVWFIDLAGVIEEALIVQIFLKSMEVSEDPRKNNEDTLIDFLKEKELLIILDNCEHLIEASSKLAEKIISICPNVKIIATSREVLRCSGEITHTISSLSIPDIKEEQTIEKLIQYESVKLFIERAVSVNSKFQVTNKNAPALAEICFQLDGIPLAIELAAARVTVLTLEKIHVRLADRFKLLTGGKRTSLPRQQTLKAMIDWSYELLSEKEKIMWRRLSVFSGGWTMDDAEELCSDENFDSSEILDFIHNLTEKSIIIFLESKERYRMLETIRQYGQEKLKEADEWKVFRSKHLNYYINVCESAIPELTGAKAKDWLNKFDDEHFNFQGALSWALEDNLFEEGSRLICALGKYWELRGYISECKSWLEKLLKNSQNISKPVLAMSNKLAGIMSALQGRYKESHKCLETALEIYESLEDNSGISATMNILGLNALDTGDHKKSKDYLEKSLILIKDTDNKIGISNMNNSLGLVDLAAGHYDEARNYFSECLRIARELDDFQYIGIGLNNLAQVEAILQNYDLAERLFEEGLINERELGNQTGIIISLINLGGIAFEKNNFDKSIQLYNESLSLSREIKFRSGIIRSLSCLGQLALSKGEISKAKILFEESLNNQKDSPDFQTVTICLIGMAAVKLSNNPELAAKLAGSVEFSYESSGSAMDASFKQFYDQTLESIKATIGNEKTMEEIENGRNIPLEKAIELCLSE